MYDDKEMLIGVPPTLRDGEMEHIVIWHDESTAHGNDHQSDYWLKDGQQVLKKRTEGG